MSPDSENIGAVPIVEESLHIAKRPVESDRVRVRTVSEGEQVVVREALKRGYVDVSRVAVDREVAAPPATREENGVTIISLVEERVIVEKRLFVVEELHLRQRVEIETTEIPVTLRRTRAVVERTGDSLADNGETHD